MVKKLLDHVFKGSARQLILRALSVKRSTPEELEEIRKILDNMEKIHNLIKIGIPGAG